MPIALEHWSWRPPTEVSHHHGTKLKHWTLCTVQLIPWYTMCHVPPGDKDTLPECNGTWRHLPETLWNHRFPLAFVVARTPQKTIDLVHCGRCGGAAPARPTAHLMDALPGGAVGNNGLDCMNRKWLKQWNVGLKTGLESTYMFGCNFTPHLH